MTVLKEARDGKIVALAISGVPDIEHPLINTHPELFKEYLRYLWMHNYKVVSLKFLINYINIDKAMKSIVPTINNELKN